MDAAGIVETYGLIGLVVVGQQLAIGALWRAYRQSQDGRISDQREAAKDMRELIDASNRSMEGLARAVERRGFGRDA